jgi:hypothetical protein
MVTVNKVLALIPYLLPFGVALSFFSSCVLGNGRRDYCIDNERPDQWHCA